MPYMQRLTWGGVALHAGHVPGYPASHGCIRMPKGFARKLYGVTGFSSTLVVVTDEKVASADEALSVA
jgi:lipoprotein-anchoring transpeptidase ErfK/SrfK